MNQNLIHPLETKKMEIVSGLSNSEMIYFYRLFTSQNNLFKDNTHKNRAYDTNKCKKILVKSVLWN